MQGYPGLTLPGRGGVIPLHLNPQVLQGGNDLTLEAFWGSLCKPHPASFTRCHPNPLEGAGEQCWTYCPLGMCRWILCTGSGPLGRHSTQETVSPDWPSQDRKEGRMDQG